MKIWNHEIHEAHEKEGLIVAMLVAVGLTLSGANHGKRPL